MKNKVSIFISIIVLLFMASCSTPGYKLVDEERQAVFEIATEQLVLESNNYPRYSEDMFYMRYKIENVSNDPIVYHLNESVLVFSRLEKSYSEGQFVLWYPYMYALSRHSGDVSLHLEPGQSFGIDIILHFEPLFEKKTFERLRRGDSSRKRMRNLLDSEVILIDLGYYLLNDEKIEIPVIELFWEESSLLDEQLSD